MGAFAPELMRAGRWQFLCAIWWRSARRDDGQVEEIAGQALRRVARSMFGLRPITHIHIMRLDAEDLQGVA